MAEAVYAIEDFPDDDLLWRIEWIGGVGYNTSVPSDPQIEICFAQFPAGETNPAAINGRDDLRRSKGIPGNFTLEESSRSVPMHRSTCPDRTPFWHVRL